MAKLSRYIVGASIAILVAAGPIQGQEAAPTDKLQEQAEQAFKKGIETVLRALGSMVKSVPQYEMPEVLKNGDIIIRRKKPQNPKKTPDDSGST